MRYFWNCLAPGQVWKEGICESLKLFYVTQQVKVLSGKGWQPTGSESCAGRVTEVRSVDSECKSRVIEPRK